MSAALLLSGVAACSGDVGTSNPQAAAAEDSPAGAAAAATAMSADDAMSVGASAGTPITPETPGDSSADAASGGNIGDGTGGEGTPSTDPNATESDVSTELDGAGDINNSPEASSTTNPASVDDPMTFEEPQGESAPSTGADGASEENAAIDISECGDPPANEPTAALEALRIVTQARLEAGAGCMTLISQLNMAAQNHCDYYAANTGSCTADPHSEVAGCDGFTGASPFERATAAGYQGRSSFEVMAFENDPQRAIDMWINSVWHRLPILSPWVTEMGYGGSANCDTIDFGRGTPLADDVIVVYPYAGQSDVPTTFHGDREGPEPPMPPSGWPSGVPINIYAKGVQISEHVLTLDGDDTPIEHMWLIPEEQDLLREEAFLYSYAPLEAMTAYRVHLVGSYVGGDVDLEWTFTTGAAEPTFGGFGGN